MRFYLGKYRNMSGAYPQVLTSQRTLFELQLTYLTTLHAVWSNAIALQNFTLDCAVRVADRAGVFARAVPRSGASLE